MALNRLSMQLLNSCQRDFPLCSRPFIQLAERFGVTEQEVIDCLQQLQDDGVLSRLGPVFDHQKAGASTLAAISVEPQQLDRVAQLVNGFAGVNHNYGRTHHYNLWFVLTAPDQQALEQTISEIEQVTGYEVLMLPMVKSYFIDLSFDIDFNRHSVAL